MPTMLAINGQLYWMIVTYHWMGAINGSVLHLTGVDGALPKLHATSCRHRHRHRQTQTQTQTQTQRVTKEEFMRSMQFVDVDRTRGTV